jgi:hypothetical protein
MISEVIRGFDHGVAGMKIGEKRVLDVPSSFGYGKRGSLPEVGPNEDLVFEIELLSFSDEVAKTAAESESEGNESEFDEAESDFDDQGVESDADPEEN